MRVLLLRAGNQCPSALQGLHLKGKEPLLSAPQMPHAKRASLNTEVELSLRRWQGTKGVPLVDLPSDKGVKTEPSHQGQRVLRLSRRRSSNWTQTTRFPSLGLREGFLK